MLCEVVTGKEMATFAARLRELRKAAGLTQQELGRRADMNRVMIARLEGGVHEPTWATVRTLARALGVSCQAFDDDAAEPAGGDALA